VSVDRIFPQQAQIKQEFAKNITKIMESSQEQVNNKFLSRAATACNTTIAG